MRKLLASGAAAFMMVAAVPALASDVARDDVAAARQTETSRRSNLDREACACSMHSRHRAPEAPRAAAQPREERESEPAQFTDMG